VKEFLLFAIMSRPAQRPTQPPVQWILRVHSLEVKQLGHEADHSLLPSAEVKNVWSYTFTPPAHPHGMVFH